MSAIQYSDNDDRRTGCVMERRCAYISLAVSKWGYATLRLLLGAYRIFFFSSEDGFSSSMLDMMIQEVYIYIYIYTIHRDIAPMDLFCESFYRTQYSMIFQIQYFGRRTSLSGRVPTCECVRWKEGYKVT